ncbi:MAG: phage portal protein [Gammaproteobacteria bacterium]|nr:phage portal protein [Gammaproteobacteria bacterium]
MLLTGRPRQETRSTAEVLSILDGQGEYNDSGTLITTQRALQQATVWSCVRILAETISSLPVKVQRRQSGQWVDTLDHPANRLLTQPNDWQTNHEYLSFLVIWSELRGNSYYLKTKDARGDTKKMFPIQSDDVTVSFSDNFSLTYKIQDGKQRGTFGADEIFHLRNLGNDGYMGLSTISIMRNTIGMALSTEQHGNKLFKNGAQPGLVVTAPSATAEQIEALQRKIDDKYAGSTNAYRTMILRGDMSVDTLSMTQSDAQYLETRHFTKQEIAAAFGVPLFVLNDTQKSTTWGTGLEQQLRAFKTLSLQPRLNRIVQTFQRELLGRNERNNTRFVFDTDALTLGDFRDRMDGYRSGIESGVLNPNEAREIEGRNPRDGGDEYRKPMNIGIEGDENAIV